MRSHDLSLKLLGHVYWHKKTEFMLEVDDYPLWTLFAVEEGRFAYRIGEHQGEASFGDLVLCPPQTAFHRQTLEPLSFHFLQFMWLSERSAEEEGDWAGKLSIQDKDRLLSNYRYLRQLQGWDEESTMHRQHMVNDLIRIVAMERALSDDKISESDELMEDARRFLLEHAYERLSMLDVAVSLGLTAVQFTRKFRRAFAQTPSEFLNEIRLTRARHLLEGSALTLEAIAAKCGYENGFYLSRVFTQKIGMAPSVYRSRHRV
ncbi:AraC family transcriptional regulator [Paenibacillus sp. HWE-109]|uniref:AraC family transcriptional regulator n=1 Tax=Paenibacillus sp. HWE-109 TaxID=1306526 RepID=UPI001EDE3E22|nr:AraC family transcriptional regulator [Paenibacillus sp. HWE-109]UKS24151.1 AraC family transcriptional regulator [Paenibacillus sp. HWE-109]